MCLGSQDAASWGAYLRDLRATARLFAERTQKAAAPVKGAAAVREETPKVGCPGGLRTSRRARK